MQLIAMSSSTSTTNMCVRLWKQHNNTTTQHIALDVDTYSK